MEIAYKKVNLTPKKHNRCPDPKVSVVVPIYKVEKYLTKCIDSIVNQTLEELEIILVDEGDFDRCREIIDFYASVDERIIAPHKKMGGYSDIKHDRILNIDNYEIKEIIYIFK